MLLVEFSIIFFLSKRCKTGKHTTEKPVLAKAGPANPPRAVPVPPVSQNNNVTAENCSRCRQGFFCSDHGNYIIFIEIMNVPALVEIKISCQSWKSEIQLMWNMVGNNKVHVLNLLDPWENNQIAPLFRHK